MSDTINLLFNDLSDDLKRKLDKGRKVNGDYSVHKGGYLPLKNVGKFVKNHVPKNLRNDFIITFITKDLDYFDFNYKLAKSGERNNRDWYN